MYYFMKKLFLISLLLLTSCSTFTKGERLLSEDEMKKYNLNGVLQEAEICPHKYDENLRQLVVSGQCEVVSCEMNDGKTICRTRAK